MATVPILVPTDSRSIGHDTEFQRLERVRAQRRARRRYRLFLVTTLAIVLAGAGVLGFATIRRTSFERLGSPSSPATVEMLRPAAASPAGADSPFGAPSAVVPPPTPADAVRRVATQPPRIEVEGDRRARPLSDNQGRGAVAPSREEKHDAEAVDPTAAIDWLLKTSRSRGH